MTWKSDGSTIALGNKDDMVCFVDYKTHKIIADKQFDFEVNEIGWNNTDEHFYLTSGDSRTGDLNTQDNFSPLSVFKFLSRFWIIDNVIDIFQTIYL